MRNELKFQKINVKGGLFANVGKETMKLIWTMFNDDVHSRKEDIINSFDEVDYPHVFLLTREMHSYQNQGDSK